MEPTTPTPEPQPSQQLEQSVAPQQLVTTPVAAPVDKKPVYKETWFWIVVVGGVLILMAAFCAFAGTLFMVNTVSSDLLYDDYGYEEGLNGGCNGNCGCQGSGQGSDGQGYNYNNNPGGSTDSYGNGATGNGGTNNSTETDPFSQFPEEIQEQLRQFHNGAQGFQDLQEYKQTMPEGNSSDL